MRIVVVGAGVVGFHLAERLSVEGHRITIIDANPDLLALDFDDRNFDIITNRDALTRLPCQYQHSFA